MRVLLAMRLAYAPALGGANKANRLLAEAFAARGHQVQALVPAVGANSAMTMSGFRHYLESQGVKVHSLPGVDVFRLNGVEVHAVSEHSDLPEHLANMIAGFQPDWILISSEDGSQSLLSAALASAPEKTVYLAHTVLFLPFGPLAFYPSPRRAELLRKAAGIIAVSHFVQAYIHKWGGLEAEVLYFPAYGSGPFANLGRFDHGYVTLINPSAGKGIDIFTALAQRFSGIPFAAVPTWGTTSGDRARLERLPNVRLLEPQEDFDQILAQTRVLLMPSLWPEAFGLTVVEAILHGIPVLASNLGGLPEAMLGAGFLLPVRPITGFADDLDDRMLPIPMVPTQHPEHIDRWCEALVPLLSDRATYERHSAAARTAATHFVAGLSAEPFEAFLMRLAANPALASAPVLTGNDGQGPDTAPDTPLAGLSPAQRALLMRWLDDDRAIEV